jgi:hypothetical protein
MPKTGLAYNPGLMVKDCEKTFAPEEPLVGHRVNNSCEGTSPSAAQRGVFRHRPPTLGSSSSSSSCVMGQRTAPCRQRLGVRVRCHQVPFQRAEAGVQHIPQGWAQLVVDPLRGPFRDSRASREGAHLQYQARLRDTFEERIRARVVAADPIERSDTNTVAGLQLACKPSVTKQLAAPVRLIASFATN